MNAEQRCQQFHPIAFVVPVDGEYPLTALNAVQTEEAFDLDQSGKGDRRYVATLLRAQTTIGGRPAIRFEEALLGEGLYPNGLMRYGYVIDRDGREFFVFTSALPNEDRYADLQAIVDQAVETLSFD